ncbi:dienelactone hydrolase-like enzyme [Halovivax asiaticus JCM 14624]|uniref:Dienelactone hydrolase-like enzyme n=1 Tax=Halovivax asiaticus JCM 14624 TaxID=1227490 RepID=M0BMU1_9EURY|nr:acyl-CoA thioester hydrolase/BAAT C-terminal domain-containing protein [Halovivax asiaticus]ELZ12211.1 dienelactone hydrolase-like enzyme [Halovivax asiaticus JCM 14624]
MTGGADAIWPADELAGVAIERLDSHDHPWPYENRVYADAGHAIRTPYRFDGEEPTADHRLGGTIEANARASADAWLLALDYLDTGLER